MSSMLIVSKVQLHGERNTNFRHFFLRVRVCERSQEVVAVATSDAVRRVGYGTAEQFQVRRQRGGVRFATGVACARVTTKKDFFHARTRARARTHVSACAQFRFGAKTHQHLLLRARMSDSNGECEDGPERSVSLAVSGSKKSQDCYIL